MKKNTKEGTNSTKTRFERCLQESDCRFIPQRRVSTQEKGKGRIQYRSTDTHKQKDSRHMKHQRTQLIEEKRKVKKDNPLNGMEIEAQETLQQSTGLVHGGPRGWQREQRKYWIF